MNTMKSSELFIGKISKQRFFRNENILVLSVFLQQLSKKSSKKCTNKNQIFTKQSHSFLLYFFQTFPYSFSI